MPVPSAPESSQPALPIPERVDAELTRRLHEQDFPGIVTNYCGAALVAWLHWNTGSRATLLAWVLAWLVANSIYLAFFLIHRRLDRDRTSTPGWRRSHLFISNVISVSPAGFMPWFFSPTPEMLYLNTVIVIIYFAGIYASNAMISPGSYNVAGGTVMAPLVAQHIALGTSESLAIAGAGLLFYFALIPFTKVQAGALRQAIRVGFENEELARNLARQTERAEQARREAEEANRAKARFLAAATHDLRQPLHALSLTLETFPARDGNAAVPMDRARDCTRQLSSMFDALLDQAQLDAGTRAIALEPVALAVLLAQLESQFSPQAQAKGLWLRCRPTRAVIRADRLALWRIASNLVTNALEATDSGGILVAWRARSRTLEVRDSGRGIAPEHQDIIFEEFRRLPESGPRGLGLGLATVRRLAGLLGGHVDVRSAPGRGSVFRLWFPAEAVLDDDTPVASRTRTPALEPPAAWVAARPGATVLAVDDDETILAALDALLRLWRFDVRLARSAAEAHSRIDAAWQPELLLLDRRLPDSDGARLARSLQAACARPPACLLITGDTAPDDLQALQASGFRVLYKPVGTDRLGAALRDLGF